ncbi:MAG: hypothetical protein AAGB93_03410, partial [Planctomycetota bacterium]
PVGAAATSTAVMGWKIATAATVPLVALGLWAGLTHRGAAVEREIAAATEPDRRDPALADVERGGGSRVAMAVHAPANERRDTASAAPPSGTPDVKTAGRIVDEWTGEPVPWMKLGFRTSYVPYEGDRAVATPGSADPDLRRSTTGPVEFDTESDATGAFQLPVGLRGDAVQFVEKDEPRYGLGGVRSRKVDLPLPDPLQVQVGPTFQLEASLPADVTWRAMEVRFAAGPDDGRQYMRTAVRDGVRPWVRFEHQVGEVAGDGPWTLEVGDRKGLWWAEAKITRKRGIEPYPVMLEFEQRGAIEFVVRCEPDRSIRIGPVQLETEAGRALRSVFLYVATHDTGSEKPKCAKARANYLMPGRYRWSRGNRTGEVEVAAGEVTRVEIEQDDGGATFDVEILVDGTGVLEASPPGEVIDLRRTPILLGRTDDPLTRVVQRLAPDTARGPGHWRLDVKGLADAEWNLVALQGLSEVRCEPRHVRITRGTTPPVLIASRAPCDAAIAVTAVDADTGEPLPSAEAALSHVDPTWRILRANDDGTMRANRQPSDRELVVLARAPGYRMTRLRILPERDGRRHEVALRHGWSSVVHVLHSGSYEPIEGVEVVVDGTSAGWTDAGGIVEIEGAGPPGSIALGGGASELEVTLSTIDRPGTPPDPSAGYMVYVRRR